MMYTFLSVGDVSGAISGLSRLYQQFWSRRGAVAVVTICTFSTWEEEGQREKEISTSGQWGKFPQTKKGCRMRFNRSFSLF